MSRVRSRCARRARVGDRGDRVDPKALKQEQAALYEAGEYSALSAVLAPAAQELVAASGVGPGDRVLDVAAGDGSVALAAAAAGALVVATDLSQVQVERGGARTAAAGKSIEWQVADAEALPFPDESFNAVLSSFGAVFAPDPALAAAELCRVCRRGGSVGLTAWPHDSMMGRLTAAVRELLPSFPDREHGWGDESTARSFLEPHADVVRCERLALRWDPSVRGAAGAADCAAAYLAGRVSPEQLGAARQALATEFGQPDGSLRAEYLLLVARRR